MPSYQSTRWVFTINNPTQADKDGVRELGGHELCRYLVCGRECGQSGTHHLQGFVVFVRGVTRTRVSSWLRRAHLESARGTSQQAAEYCKKDGDFDEYGAMPNARSNSVLDDLYAWGDEFIANNGRAPTSPEIARAQPTAYLRYPRVVKLFEAKAPIPEIVEGEPHLWQAELAGELEGDADDRSVIFYVDPEGGKGKTWFQQWFYANCGGCAQILSAGKRDDMALAIDKTKRVFFFNVPRGGMEYLQYTILEQLKDQMIWSPKYNSCTKFLVTRPHVVVFCNEDPDMDKMSSDRYDIRTNYEMD